MLLLLLSPTTTGKLTETQVLLAHGTKLQLDRYGFILGESDMAGRTAGAAAGRQQRTASQVCVLCGLVTSVVLIVLCKSF